MARQMLLEQANSTKEGDDDIYRVNGGTVAMFGVG